MPDPTTIRVNFGRAVPLFPLNEAVLMPHGLLPLNIFEPRYRQMVSDALDGSGQIAMAVFEGGAWQEEYHGRPPIRPFVCLGQIVQHHKLPDGRFNILLQGVCRARILSEIPPHDGRLYREAMLEPVGVEFGDESALDQYRRRLKAWLAGPLADLRGADQFKAHLDDANIPTSAILELLALTLLSNPETRYRLLAAGDPDERARIVSGELAGLERLIRRAAPQRALAAAAPKGCTWN
jgi:uncharacterized protein